MLVEVSIDIRAPKASVWAKMTELENAAAFISGIDKIEILEQPASGLVGLKWLFKGVAKKALRQDLIDIKLAAESAMVG